MDETENKMKQYLDSLHHILLHGKDRDDRTGVGTRGIFGHQMRFDLRNEFPAVTTKKLAWKSVVSELLVMSADLLKYTTVNHVKG
jgi:thymidylate synthase